MSAVGLGLATPNEKLFIFDIQNAMAGLFFFHHHLRGEKGGEERRRGGIAAIDVPRFQVHIPQSVALPRSRSLCLWPQFPPFAGHLRTAPDVPGSSEKRLTGKEGKLNTCQAEPVAANSWAVGQFPSFSCEAFL